MGMFHQMVGQQDQSRQGHAPGYQKIRGYVFVFKQILGAGAAQTPEASAHQSQDNTKECLIAFHLSKLAAFRICYHNKTDPEMQRRKAGKFEVPLAAAEGNDVVVGKKHRPFCRENTCL